MKFTKLRLLGFKSFVEPSEFVIERGLTGVVGPNGCGKSNLVEALRWVMGENSYKNMRASGMDDVIFSGSGNRPARNHAEVSLTIDNSDRTAPAGFNDDDELTIVRRITRDAGSAYRVGGREVRARDVAILFADASTGAQSPALVRQGQIAELIPRFDVDAMAEVALLNARGADEQLVHGRRDRSRQDHAEEQRRPLDDEEQHGQHAEEAQEQVPSERSGLCGRDARVQPAERRVHGDRHPPGPPGRPLGAVHEEDGAAKQRQHLSDRRRPVLDGAPPAARVNRHCAHPRAGPIVQSRDEIRVDRKIRDDNPAVVRGRDGRPDDEMRVVRLIAGNVGDRALEPPRDRDPLRDLGRRIEVRPRTRADDLGVARAIAARRVGAGSHDRERQRRVLRGEVHDLALDRRLSGLRGPSDFNR